MNERFWVTSNPKYLSVVFDERQKKHYIGTDLEDLLNEQQATIDILKEENEKLKKRLYLYEMNEDEVDKYLRTHPMPTITNERTITPLDMRHRW